MIYKTLIISLFGIVSGVYISLKKKDSSNLGILFINYNKYQYKLIKNNIFIYIILKNQNKIRNNHQL